VKRRRRRSADIEAGARAAVGAVAPPVDKAPHDIARIEPAIVDQAGGQSEGHGRVVGPLSRLEAEGATTNHVMQRGVCVARPELERCADRVAHRQSQQGAHSAVADRLGRGRRQGWRRCGRAANMRFLCLCLDGPRPCAAYGVDRLVRRPAQLDQQSRSDGARATKPALAMHEDREAIMQPRAQLFAGLGPGLLEIPSGRLAVADGQVIPVHGVPAHFQAKTANVEGFHLMALDQGHNGTEAGLGDDGNVPGQVPLPAAAEPMPVLLARAQAEPDPA